MTGKVHCTYKHKVESFQSDSSDDDDDYKHPQSVKKRQVFVVNRFNDLSSNVKVRKIRQVIDDSELEDSKRQVQLFSFFVIHL